MLVGVHDSGGLGGSMQVYVVQRGSTLEKIR